jgi:hypothetical protein
MFHPQVIKMENQTRSFLIYIHQQSNICKKGVQGDHLDITEVLKKFKSASKMFDKHRSDIKKLDTETYRVLEGETSVWVINKTGKNLNVNGSELERDGYFSKGAPLLINKERVLY